MEAVRDTVFWSSAVRTCNSTTVPPSLGLSLSPALSPALVLAVGRRCPGCFVPWLFIKSGERTDDLGDVTFLRLSIFIICRKREVGGGWRGHLNTFTDLLRPNSQRERRRRRRPKFGHTRYYLLPTHRSHKGERTCWDPTQH